MKTQNLAAGAVCLGLLGCQLLLSADRTQCAADADCAGRGGVALVCRDEVCVASGQTSATTTDAGAEAGFDPTSPWGCLANPPSRVVEDRAVPVTVRQRFVVYSLSDCEHNRPVPGAELKLCSQRDVTCGSPVETAVTDCDGYVTFKATYRGFEGYAIVTPPTKVTNDAGVAEWNPVTKKCFQDLYDKEAAAGQSGGRCAIAKDGTGQVVVPLPEDLVPGILTIVPPPAVSADVNSVIGENKAPHLFSSNTLKSLLAVVGKPFDAKAGHLGGLTVDCQGQPSPGVTISVTGAIGPNSQVYYTDSQALPNVNQGVTGERGETGYLNLDPGTTGVNIVSVSATLQQTGERIGVYAALVRSGHITYLEMPPLRN